MLWFVRMLLVGVEIDRRRLQQMAILGAARLQRAAPDARNARRRVPHVPIAGRPSAISPTGSEYDDGTDSDEEVRYPTQNDSGNEEVSSTDLQAVGEGLNNVNEDNAPPRESRGGPTADPPGRVVADGEARFSLRKFLEDRHSRRLPALAPFPASNLDGSPLRNASMRTEWVKQLEEAIAAAENV